MKAKWLILVRVIVDRLDTALDAAEAESRTIVDLKNDWKTIFPFGSK